MLCRRLSCHLKWKKKCKNNVGSTACDTNTVKRVLRNWKVWINL